MQSGEAITADSISDDAKYPVFGGNGLRGYAVSYTHDGLYVLIGRQGALCGNINYARGKFWASEHAIVVSPTQRLNAVWLGEQLRAMNLNQYSVAAAQPGLSVDAIGRLAIAFPPYSEQKAIGDFLEQETAKIDALVAEQRRLIELLMEKRQAVISHTVTKGLDPDASMKPSGVEWLGEVPKHWELTRLGNLFAEVAENGNGDLPILSVSIHHGVSDDELGEDEMERKVSRSDDRSKYKRVAPGDLVYNMMRAWQGGFGTVNVEGMVSPAYVVARPRRPLCTAFIEYLLRTPSAIEQMRRHSRGVTDFRLRLYWDEFKNISVPLPPLHEAQAICEQIADMDAQFDALTVTCESSVRLLEERRMALISAAVTGQIDVRGVVEPVAA